MFWTKLPNLLARQRMRQRSMLTRDESTLSDSTIIVPLYIYPEPGSWELLHESIRKHSNLRFVVIVNPFNGPGSDALPDENYLREIPRLTRYPSVDLVGYVHTTFTRRDVSAVINDISIYSGWAEQAQHPGLGISGIFVDETPNQYDARAQQYLHGLTKFAKSCKGFGSKKLLIHNPGCVPSPAYMALADITVVFEDTWQTFEARRREGLFDLQKLSGQSRDSGGFKVERNSLAVMIHSVPRDLSMNRARIFAEQSKQTAGFVFITEADIEYYSRWSSRWTEWLELLSKG